MGHVRDIVDSKVVTYNTTTLDFVRKLQEQDFDTPIEEQGSGIRSLICLIADIISSRQSKLILIDEPELGLNPTGKHALLRYLTKEAKEKQIFIATHDPTFVNPVLWDTDKVSVYLYSPAVDTARARDKGFSFIAEPLEKNVCRSRFEGESYHIFR